MIAVAAWPMQMSPEERSLVLALAVVPGRKPMPAEQFLREFGVADGAVLGLDLLRDAADRRDPVDVELALIVSFSFGFTDDHLQPLIGLAFDDWHQRHEDVAWALGKLRSPASVDALTHLGRVSKSGWGRGVILRCPRVVHGE